MRYCGDASAGVTGLYDSSNISRDVSGRSLSRQSTATAASVTSAAVDSGRGSVQLARAGMTLHDVQVQPSGHYWQ